MEWQRNALKSIRSKSSPTINADFGFHYPLDIVNLCYIFLERWHMPPNETLNTPEQLLYDIMRRANLGDVEEHNLVNFTYEEIDNVDDIPTLRM